MVSTPFDVRSLAALASTGLMLVAFGLGSSGCTAPTEVQQGGEGEYCNDDVDCRDGLSCDNFVCSADEDPEEVTRENTCETVCNRLQDCEASLQNCSQRCLNTANNWGPSALEDFETCFTDDYSCSELRASQDPPQMCYDEISIDEERLSTCDDYRSAASSCGAEDQAVNEFRIACRGRARTAGTEDWSEIEACTDHLEGACEDLYGCLNSTLEFDPQFQ